MSQPSDLSNQQFEEDDNPCRTQSVFSVKQWLYLQDRYNLTPRERQIAQLACKGRKNKDIADDLRISAGTAKTHTRNIYRKVRVKSKIAMLFRFLTDLER